MKFWNQRQLKRGLEVNKKEKEIIVENLEQDIKELEEEIESSDSLKFVEKIAREELGMVKPREIIVIDKNAKTQNYINDYKLDR